MLQSFFAPSLPGKALPKDYVMLPRSIAPSLPGKALSNKIISYSHDPSLPCCLPNLYVTKFCPKNMLCSKAPSLHCCQASLLFWTWWKIVKCVRKGGKSITVCPAITILLGAKSDFVTMLFGRRLKETDCLLLAFSAATIFPCHHLQPIFVLEKAHFINAFYKCIL